MTVKRSYKWLESNDKRKKESKRSRLIVANINQKMIGTLQGKKLVSLQKGSSFGSSLQIIMAT